MRERTQGPLGGRKTKSVTASVLNVGSGGRPNPSWTNLDIVGFIGWIRKIKARTPPNFVKHRLPKSLPFNDQTFEAIYCAQVIEHFNRNDAFKIFTEFRRVLANDGFARVIVPNLETQVRQYLDTLADVRSNPTPTSMENYRFAKLWLIEQFVRRTPGGELTTFLSNASPAMQQRLRAEGSEPNAMISRLPAWLRHILVVRTGQLHQWAYDSNDLVCMAKEAGFSRVEIMSSSASIRPDFVAFDNDARGELQVGSLYVECFR